MPVNSRKGLNGAPTCKGAEPESVRVMSWRTRIAVNVFPQRRPPAANSFSKEQAKISRYEFVPDLCQRIADLAVLADLVRRKNSKLRAINGGRGTDSVPGHHVLKHLRSFQFDSTPLVGAERVPQRFAVRRKTIYLSAPAAGVRRSRPGRQPVPPTADVSGKKEPSAPPTDCATSPLGVVAGVRDRSPRCACMRLNRAAAASG